MSIRTYKRALAALLTAALLLGLSGGLLSAFAAGSTIEIGTAEELCEFSKNCSLDTWSQGKTFTLTADIDLTGVDFTPVPTFGGVFNGGGHTISGLRLKHSGSNQGLFRFVQQSGEIRNLRVSGQVTPGGSASSVGGIAGSNSGLLRGCSFSGTVTGKVSTGGVVGLNEGSGELISCSASGIITGEHYTGGIIGQNLGAAVGCENRAQVNTREAEISVDLDEMNWSHMNSAENMNAATDTGGVVGYSTGIVQSCLNEGTVGYPHTGYNVGGVAGRQAGYLDGCVNRGTVYGRKDVGGIVGQIEPYMLLQFTEDSLQKLDGELDTLRGLLSDFGDEASLTGDLVGARADAMSSQLEEVRTGAHDVAGWTGDFLDGTVDTVNDLSARVTRTFDRLEPIMGDLGDAGDEMGRAFRRIEGVFDDIDDVSDWGEAALYDARDAFDRMDGAMDDAGDAMDSIRDALEALRRNPNDQQARAQLSGGIASLRQALNAAGGAPDQISDALRELENMGAIAPNAVPGALEDFSGAFEDAAGALDAIEGGISGLLPGLDGSGTLDRLRESMRLLRQGMSSASSAVHGLHSAAGSVGDAFRNIEVFSRGVGDALSGMGRAFDLLESASDSATRAARGMEDMIGELADEPALEMPALNSEYTSTVDNIFDSLGSVSDEMDALRTDLSGSGDRMHGTAQAVNDQIGVVSDLLMEGYNEVLGSDDESERLEDISDTEDGGVEGRVSDSRSSGRIEGDVNVGGIVGSMAIEYDLDPEDDIINVGDRSIRFSYQTRAVLTGCGNYGTVTAKKNCAGGIVGRMDLGRVSSCEGYGTVESTGGIYVGGIAGASYAVIRDSWAKCALTGTDYVGGIAGLGQDMTDCRALADIRADGEYIGAIAGDADGTLERNVFVSDEHGGVDGVSYAGKAAPIPYEQLLAAANLPYAFRQFTVTFLVDDETLAQQTVGYGESLTEIPEIPAREGLFGEWSDEDFTNLHANKTVKAIYSPYITVLECGMAQNGRPELLAEGKFDRHAELTLEPAKNAPAGAPGEPLHAAVTHASADSSGHLLRALAANEENAVYVAENGRWRKADSIRDGSYLVFTIDGDEAVYCLTSEVSQSLTLLLAAGIAGLLLAGFLRRRGKRRRAKRKDGTRSGKRYQGKHCAEHTKTAAQR